jgi:hypothetical protein
MLRPDQSGDAVDPGISALRRNLARVSRIEPGRTSQAKALIYGQGDVVARVIEGKNQFHFFQPRIANEFYGPVWRPKIECFPGVSSPIIQTLKIKTGAAFSQERFHVQVQVQVSSFKFQVQASSSSSSNQSLT